MYLGIPKYTRLILSIRTRLVEQHTDNTKTCQRYVNKANENPTSFFASTGQRSQRVLSEHKAHCPRATRPRYNHLIRKNNNRNNNSDNTSGAARC